MTNNLSTHFIVNNGCFNYYSIDKLPLIHSEMLHLLKIIDDISKQHNIPYWLDGGSLIGAVRHKGFIPWDDDMDISLIKEDYIRLIEKLTEYSQNHNDTFVYYAMPQNKHCCNFFGSKRIMSRMRGSLIPIPVKIDIRPLNCYTNSKEGISQNNIFRDLANQLIFGTNKGYVSQEMIDETLENGYEKFFLEYNNNYGMCARGEQTLLSTPYFEFSNEFEFKMDNIFPIAYVDYEDIKLPIPTDYDILLKNLYGDYMQLPPLSNRAPVAYEVITSRASEMVVSLNRQFNISGKRNSVFARIMNLPKYLRIFGFIKLVKILFYER